MRCTGCCGRSRASASCGRRRGSASRSPSWGSRCEPTPHVVQGVDLGERCEVVAGSFFEFVPEGADAYLLKSILHDWEDEEAAAIVRTIRRGGGVLLVLERIVGPPNESPEGKLSDLNMLVGPGGRERTEDEYASLFQAGGYRLVGVTPTESGMHVIEGAPA